ncbi:AbrB/MazE/SpoVT family DNA-binding domain-containing protein [Thiolapillus sp.]|uniref:AbrB/MazE/SpoVT family DNA-binding domain-containing protein n=1 Tax=Thiolapillus sp. TaxID=2017437 RepID=UPI003AF691C6
MCLTNFIDDHIVKPFHYRCGFRMQSVTVSPKFQVVIPKEIRESMGIVSGQKIQVLAYKNRIELIPVKPVKNMKGILKGIDTSVERDADRL